MVSKWKDGLCIFINLFDLKAIIPCISYSCQLSTTDGNHRVVFCSFEVYLPDEVDTFIYVHICHDCCMVRILTKHPGAPQYSKSSSFPKWSTTATINNKTNNCNIFHFYIIISLIIGTLQFYDAYYVPDIVPRISHALNHWLLTQNLWRRSVITSVL